MKRRLSVAIACLGNPRVLILDEPTTGLDPISRRRVWTLIEDMKPGRVVLLTTHNLADANSLADKVGTIHPALAGCRMACSPRVTAHPSPPVGPGCHLG